MVLLSRTTNITISTMLFASVLCCAPSSHAEEEHDPLAIELKTEVATLIASPDLCEFQKGQTTCQMEVTLLWETPRAGDYCILDSELEVPLACWENVWSGSHSFNFISGRNHTYWLTQGEKGGVAAQTTITVTSALEQRMRSRRRRGFWRVF